MKVLIQILHDILSFASFSSLNLVSAAHSNLTRWSFSTQNAPGRRNLSFYLHLPKFVYVKAVYPSDNKIFLSSFVKFVFIIG